MIGLRTGFTTGTCAAAAAKAATMALVENISPEKVRVKLPDDTGIDIKIEKFDRVDGCSTASVRKNAGDDPDVTDGCLVSATVCWSVGNDLRLLAGSGVGTVTKPGLSIPPGEPAINPVPREMIKTAVREVTAGGLDVTISIQGGEALAEKTFNPKLGIVGGLSILGTSGIVKPFSSEAARDALKCELNVAVACNIKNAVLVPGRIGEKAGRNLFELTPEQVIEVGNEWGFFLDELLPESFDQILVVGHPGKLAKLPAGWWDTHSSRSSSAVPYVNGLADELNIQPQTDSRTVEGIFSALDEKDSRGLGCELSSRISDTIARRLKRSIQIAVLLVNMKGLPLGEHGNSTAWKRKDSLF